MTSALCLIGAAGSTSGDIVQRNVETISKSRGRDPASENAMSQIGGLIAVTAQNDNLTKDQVFALAFRERRYSKPVAQDQPQEFGCPQCQARYKIVRVDAGPQPVNRPLYCKVCRWPFVSTDGEDILKYFLIDRPITGSPRGR